MHAPLQLTATLLLRPRTLTGKYEGAEPLSIPQLQSLLGHALEQFAFADVIGLTLSLSITPNVPGKEQQ